jgi:hypothetical protein
MSSVEATTIISSAITMTLAASSREAGSTIGDALFNIPAGVFDTRYAQWRVSCDQLMVVASDPPVITGAAFCISAPLGEAPTPFSAAGAIIASVDFAANGTMYMDPQRSCATVPNLSGRQLRIRVIDAYTSPDALADAAFAAAPNPWLMRLSFAPIINSTLF